MNKKQVVKKLDKLVTQRIANLMSSIKDYECTIKANPNASQWEANRIKDLKVTIDNTSIKNAAALRYFTRLHMFKAANLTFNPETYEGESYNWYSICRKFEMKNSKPVFILNTYGYSNTTSKQVGKLMRLFGQLGIAYSTLEAPQGLQDLNTALSYNIEKLAATIVKQGHGRRSYKGSIAYYKRQLALLAKLGYTYSEQRLVTAIEITEENRKRRLAREKEQRKQAFIEHAYNRLVGVV